MLGSAGIIIGVVITYIVTAIISVETAPVKNYF